LARRSAILATFSRDSFGRFTKKQPLPEPNADTYTPSFYSPLSTETDLPPSLTRPSSGLSNFETIDNVSNTPFELTPETSPTKPTSTPLPESDPSPTHDNMATEQVNPFHGDKKDENPEDFLRSFYRRMGTASDDTRKQQFRYFLQADSAADEWFDDLPAADKKDWTTIETAFNKRWPRKKAAKKTKEEYEEEIMGTRLQMEDLGKKEKTAGRETYSHIAWADKMEVIVRGAKIEETTTYIGQVRKELPKLLREKVGTGHTDWAAFLQVVRDVDLDHIKEGVSIWKQEQEEQQALRKRIQHLEKLTASPTAPLRHQMTTFTLGDPQQNSPQPARQVTTTPHNPFTGNSGGSGNLFTPKNTRPPPTQADKAALLARLQKYPHHPDTEAGRQAHRAQQTEWVKTHGLTAIVTESTPYPLRPGTCPVNSGECFTCGLRGHLGRRDGSTCGGNRSLNTREQAWRAICSRILRETRTPANIQIVEVDDYGTTWQEVQGKEDGPSN
jgi:hypothetical protein